MGNLIRPKDSEITNLASLLSHIKAGTIEYGFDKDYFIVFDEDGYFNLLRRPVESDGFVYEEYVEFREETEEHHWPCNAQDGIELFSRDTGRHDSVSTIEELLSLVNLTYM